MAETIHKENKKLANARQVLDNYLSLNRHRKTPERYAVLEAAYSLKGYFTMEDLDKQLRSIQFRVSRATLYSTIKLFMELRLVVKHHLTDGIRYETCQSDASHCHQVCTVCGKTTELKKPEINAVIDSLKLRRFRKDGFSLSIFGVCSSCQAKITRMQNKKR